MTAAVAIPYGKCASAAWRRMQANR